MQSLLYKCPACHEEVSPEEWHNKTAEIIGCDIESLELLGGQYHFDSFYHCPYCEIEVSGNAIIGVEK